MAQLEVCQITARQAEQHQPADACQQHPHGTQGCLKAKCADTPDVLLGMSPMQRSSNPIARTDAFQHSDATHNSLAVLDCLLPQLPGVHVLANAAVLVNDERGMPPPARSPECCTAAPSAAHIRRCSGSGCGEVFDFDSPVLASSPRSLGC